MYFHKVTPSVSASPASSSISSTTSISATHEIERPILPLSPPPQPTQHEGNEDEDFYDDTLPLNSK